ncbi:MULTISPECIES: DUF4157 domain-containing protein [unclassified Kitasatospora]|uniref:eCIS core domain-containing protein n=1 Tax=unclassified Kitasatospora TaxID=2633591 RepID=UPI0038200A3B
MHAKDPGKPSEPHRRRDLPRKAAPAADGLGLSLGGGSAQTALALQRGIGNAAVSRVIERSRHQHGAGCDHPQAAVGAGAPVQRSTVHDVLSTGGRPLDDATRTEMEARIGADFSDVRIHTGQAARASAAEVGARAYTSGNHVVIGDGGMDRHTLAHELTHVVQQRQGPVAGTDNGDGLKVSSPSDRFEREAEANATRVLSGAVPAQRRTGDAPAARPGAPVVQRAITYAKADWSRQHLSPDRFAELLHQASGEQEGVRFSVPYKELFKALEESAITIEIDEQTDIKSARALFALSNEGEGGALRITPPKDDASPLELREFAATVTHEMQHALDSVTGRFKSQEKPQTMAQRKISTELRAFGEEAAAALKLAMGDGYSKSQGKLSAILKTIPGDRLTPERSRLAGEFHMMDSYRAANRDPLDAFGAGIPIPDSVLLERVAGYLSFYKLVVDTPTSAEALQWLRATPAVVEKGLVEGIVLFHNHRPQPE